MKLTVRNIEKIAPADRDVIVWDDDLKGFGLKVTPKGRRVFFLYYRTADHAQRRPAIGTYPAMRPEQARNIARLWLSDVRAGGDPSGERLQRRAVRGTGTIADLFVDYLNEKATLRSIKEVERIFRHDILPVLGRKRPENISRLEITTFLSDIYKRSPSLAHAVKRQLSAFFTWALPNVPELVDNTVKNAGRLKALDKRKRVLKETELQALWEVLNTQPDPWRTALQLLILTGQRKNEVLQAHWCEFDLDDALWTIPAARAKNGQEHTVPLSPAVVAKLRQMQTQAPTGRLFNGGTGPVSRAAKRIRDSMPAGTPPWRWHDLRRTTATGLQRLGIRLEVTEAVLNHKSGSKGGIAGVYQLHDWAEEKRVALDAWAAEVERMVCGPSSPESAKHQCTMTLMTPLSSR